MNTYVLSTNGDTIFMRILVDFFTFNTLNSFILTIVFSHFSVSVIDINDGDTTFVRASWSSPSMKPLKLDWPRLSLDLLVIFLVCALIVV